MNNYEKSALFYGQALCDTILKKFPAPQLPPVHCFHYNQGVCLSGMQKIYYLCKEEKYAEYIKDWVDSTIDENGKIDYFDITQIDYLNPGILLFRLNEITEDGRYKKALDYLLSVLEGWKVNEEGGFWHKECYPNQMWLDGLYMAGPLAMEYGAKFNEPKWFDVVTKQALLMKKHLLDEKTGLYYHAWDCSKEVAWCDKVTGRSPEFWGRAIGWYIIASIDILDYLPRWHKNYKEMVETVYHLLCALVDFQDKESGMWYQVVDKGDREENWLESSCSSLFTAALYKAMRKGYIDKSFLEFAEKGFKGTLSVVKFDEDGNELVGEICIGTSVSDYQTYIERPRSVNDLHGMGAFLLMCAEKQMYDEGAERTYLKKR